MSLLSSGARSALGEAASWTVAGICVAASIIYFDELKATFSPFPQQVAGNASNQQTIANRAARQTTTQRPVETSAGYTVKLQAGPYGHFKTSARVNGRGINVLVDTGASYVALTAEDAERAGVFVNPSDFTHKTQTANGQSSVAIVNIDRISIGDIEVRNVRATVHERGKLNVTLLGMSFLGQLRRSEIRSGQMVLEN